LEVLRSAALARVAVQELQQVYLRFPKEPEEPPVAVRTEAAAAAARLMQALAATGARIVLEAPKRVLPSPSGRCLTAFNRTIAGWTLREDREHPLCEPLPLNPAAFAKLFNARPFLLVGKAMGGVERIGQRG
jgi:5-enolpyruvylshikimate-3-phosphate synthase